MKITQINPELRPDLFFLPQDKLDAEGQAAPILDAEGVDTGKVEQKYTVKAIVDKASIVDYDIIKRKSAKGIAEFRSYAEQTEIWHEIDGHKFKLADHAFYLEYLDGEKWIRSKGSSTQIGEISIAADGDIIRADVDSETGKYTFTLGKKGYTIRGVWVINRYQVYEDCFDDLQLDISDYTGNIDDSDWVDNVRTIVFESKGIKDKLVVDPYLGVDEQSDYIDVECDGYTWHFTWSDWDAYPVRIDDPISAAHLGKIMEILYVGGTAYKAKYDPNRTVVLSAVTDTRVDVVLTGTYYASRGGAQIPNALTYTILLTLYENSAFARITLHVPATTTIDRANYGSLFGLVCYNTNHRIYNYGTATTDTTTTGALIDVTSYNYAGEREDSFNYQGILIENDSTPATEITLIYGYYNVNPVGTLATGDYKYTIGYFMNAPDSVNDVIPDSTARLAIGNEFTNISTDLTTTGVPVTGLSDPATIDSTSGFAADGAFHVKDA